jgi:hypothetical protein
MFFKRFQWFPDKAPAILKIDLDFDEDNTAEFKYIHTIYFEDGGIIKLKTNEEPEIKEGSK